MGTNSYKAHQITCYNIKHCTLSRSLWYHDMYGDPKRCVGVRTAKTKEQSKPYTYVLTKVKVTVKFIKITRRHILESKHKMIERKIPWNSSTSFRSTSDSIQFATPSNSTERANKDKKMQGLSIKIRVRNTIIEIN